MASGAESTADSGILAGAVGKGVCDSIYLGQIDLAVGEDLGRDLIARGGGAHAITAGSADGLHAFTHAPAMPSGMIEQAVANGQAVLLPGVEILPLIQRGCLVRPGEGR